MPTLQCKGVERRIRTDIIRLRKGERVKRRKRTRDGAEYIVSFVKLSTCVCVCVFWPLAG